MKIVKNTTLRGFNIPFRTPQGVKTLFFAPKQQREIPDSWKSKVAETFMSRRMVKIQTVVEPVYTPKAEAPVKRVKKTLPKLPQESD